MNHLSKKLSILLGAIFLSCSIVSCGDNSPTGDNTDPVLSSISLSGSYPTSFTVGDTFSHSGAVVTAHYTRGKADAVVTNAATFSGYNMSNAGSQTVTVSYTEAAITKTTSYTISVSSGGSSEDGNGSESSPYSVAQACSVAATLGTDGTSELSYFIKGKVTGTVDTSGVSGYGNINFDITDTGSGTTKFKCFQVYYLNKVKFTSTTAASLKSGDTVVIFSKIVNYRGNTPETTSKGTAYVYQHNDQKSSTIPEQGFPEEDPNAKVRTISALISEKSSWKTEGADSSTLYRITGIAQYAVNSNWGNFDLLDSTGYIYIHGCVSSKKGLVNDGANGKVIDNDKSFSSIGILPGDEVTIEGWYAYHKYTNSYGIPQFTGYVTKLTKKGASTINPQNYSAAETYSGSYYDSVSSLTGNELLKGLHNLMDSTHSTYTSYGSLDSYFSTSDPYSGGGVKCFYSGEKASSYNKEHVWPQSLSGSSSSQLYGEDHGGSDLHHIRPTISKYNSLRSSAMFGYVYGSDSYKGRTISYQGGGTDYSVTNVFEPADSIKGDVARIIMYMYMHYNDGTINELSSITGWNKQSYYGQMNVHWVMGPTTVKESFKLLRQWNSMDPVSQDEITRNNKVYQVQGNRNPFIDHPSYADKIWG